MTAPTIVLCGWCHLQWRLMGDEAWRPITAETPLDESEASHGMCPDCYAIEVMAIETRHAARAEVRP